MARASDPHPARGPAASAAAARPPAVAPGPLPPARGERSADGTARRPGRVAAAVAGVAAAALALGMGELVAGLDARLRSPIEAVATEVIDRAPRPIERFAIETFGTNDKLVLVIGILAMSAVFGAVLGIVARRRPLAGPVGMAMFGLLGVLASLGAPNSTAVAALPSVAAAVAGALALRLLVPAPAAAPGDGDAGDAGDGARPPDPLTRGGVGSRRAFLGLTAAVTASAALAAAGGRALRGRFSAAESRAGVTLPRPAAPLPAIPPTAEAGVEGIAPFVTPNRDFYRVDTALLVPQVRAEDWTLSVTGMVDEPFELTYAELSDLDIVEADITMTCISNQVGGNLVGNARWLGVLTRDLLDRARPQRRADQLVGRSTDGYTCGFPIEAAYDRPCLVAIGMNAEPLPLRHGFPARLVTPGIYGCVGSTKWLTELEVTTFDAFDQYWVPRGYAEQAPIKTMARIDTPRSFELVAAGRVMVGGVAWAQTRGISAVEIRIDDGDFEPAVLAGEVARDTWRQWRYGWDATPGRHDLTVRAVDGSGERQTEERAEPLPDGASGWMSLVVNVG
jgi:DMSO/TMAO reductase YedYZ molybdopterin-dependent catalytic subunit